MFEGLNNPRNSSFFMYRTVIFLYPVAQSYQGNWHMLCPILLMELNLWVTPLPACSTVPEFCVRLEAQTFLKSDSLLCGFLWQGSSCMVGCTSFSIYHQSEEYRHSLSFILVIS